jgi:predicted transcriptional regulator
VSVSRPLLLLAALLAGAAATACEGPRDVAVRVSIPAPDSSDTPVSGVGLVALPYDRDSVLASLEARARSPRPATARLDSLFAGFRAPFNRYATATLRLGRLQDSAAALKARLDTLPRNAPEYGRLYAGLEGLADTVTAAQRETDAARAALDRARTGFVAESESLRAAIRHWEDSTYRGYDSIVRTLATSRRQEPLTDTTDAQGWAQFRLSPGRWWIYGRSWDATDPNAEWYWNAPADGDTILLSARSGQRRPRY